MSLLDMDDFADEVLTDEAFDDETFAGADALRQALRADYADASDEEVEGALASMLDSMSPAESFNFASALNQIGKSSGKLLSDPTFGAIARTALPIAGGALGTVIGGPVGTALGTQLGSIAAGALPTGQRPPPRGPVRPGAVPQVAVPMPPSGFALAPTPAAAGAVASPVASGSAAAAQGLVLTQQPQVLQSLLATALGQHGRQQVGGIPNAQLLGMLSQIFGQAAADADELIYLGGRGEDGEEVLDESAIGAGRSLYASLVDADNLEFAEAFEDEEHW